jgi:tripartite ATP-independent transporter DctP family solute receptor
VLNKVPISERRETSNYLFGSSVGILTILKGEDKMGKRLMAIVLVTLMFLALITFTASAETITLRAGHKSSAKSSWQLGAEYWAELLKEKTNGEIILEIYPNSELGDQKEMTELAQIGVLDIVLNAPATLGQFMTEITALDLPFLFRDYDHAFECMDTVVLDYYKQAYLDAGLVCLANWDTGFKMLSNSIRPINKAEDIAGLKIRYAGGQALAATIQRLNASAISIPWSETYVALSQGTADAQFNPASTMVESKIHEVQKYYASNLPIQYGAEPITMSLISWNKLSPEHQTALVETCQEAAYYQRDLSIKMDIEAQEVMKAEGCVINEVAPEELNKIREMTASLLDEYCPPELLEMIRSK